MKEFYVDEKCPICSEPFREQDDIVICPECGAPYHRDCYKEQGSCIHTEKHGEYEWKGDKQILKERCENLHSARMKAISESDDEEIDVYRVTSLEEFREAMDKRLLKQQKDFPEVEEVTAEELIKFCGKNAAYYLPVFRDIAKYGKILKLNFAAFVFFPLHCFFRRMNLFGAITLFAIMSMMEARILLADSNNILGLTPEMASICTVLVMSVILAALVFVLMFFNYFYFRFAIKKIKNVKSEYASLSRQEILRRIAEAGRPSIFSGLAFGICAELVLSLAFQILNNYVGVAI